MPDSGRAPRRCRPLVGMTLVFLSSVAGDALGYGPQGHLIAGRVAEDLLCERAASMVADLRDGGGLGEIGLWADQIRSDDAYDHAAPWHYMNIADGQRLGEFVHPPEGDVLWAIEHFSERLGDATLGRTERSEALGFLVHFIVDIHQPLHVGLAEDRGGNAIELRYKGETTNLHRLWDTDVIDWTGLSVADYAASIAGGTAARNVSLDPLVWVAESLALRPRVYDYGRDGREPPADYLDSVAAITRERLMLAALRLAGTLNSILC